nr:MAG TPA: hypothetical protein [Caudoviricetes sp.]
MLRRVWETVRLFIGHRTWLLNIVASVVGGLLWCWYVVDLWVTGVVVEAHRVCTKPLRRMEQGVLEDVLNGRVIVVE